MGQIKIFIAVLLIFVSLISFGSQGAYAAKDKDPENSGRDAIKKSITDIYDGLDDKQRQHFFLIYNNYNIIESVKIVRDDVSAAVKACGDNNPDIKVLMDSRYKTWSDSISPILKDSSANLQNMIIAQDYASSDELQNVLDTIDATRDMVNSQIEKVPVTSPEACEFLREKMDETQERLITLLKSALKTVPQMFPGTGDDADL